MPVRVYLETGAKRTFACALDWPGWCRSGKDEGVALAALETYAARYRPVAEAAGFPLPADVAFDVVERLTGNATTDFGAPAIVAGQDSAPLDAAAQERLSKLLDAARATFERVASSAPAELRKGPRGGGRDTEAIRRHVSEADAAYVRKLSWPPAYAARRRAWHLLDHAWEIEDKS